MSSKICFKCGLIKPLEDYYRHNGMSDGRLNKCKDCTKKDTKKRTDELLKDPNWAEKERQRHRKKYHRLGYLEKHKPIKESKKNTIKKYFDRFPEKTKFKGISKLLQYPEGKNEAHHWSYNPGHKLSVIFLTTAEHNKAHRFITYDQERFMYRRIDDNSLLDTKERHEEWIIHCIKTKPE
jgi:hypothetical protein